MALTQPVRHPRFSSNLLDRAGGFVLLLSRDYEIQAVTEDASLVYVLIRHR